MESKQHFPLLASSPTTATLRAPLHAANQEWLAFAEHGRLVFQDEGGVYIRCINPSCDAQIKERLDQGEKFEELVRQYSQNSLSRERGGLLPPFAANDDTVPAVFVKTAFALKEGEYSNPIESEGSYHVLKLERRIPAETVPLEEVKSKLRMRLDARLSMQAMQDLSARLLMQAELLCADPVLREQYRAQQASGQIHGPVLIGQ